MRDVDVSGESRPRVTRDCRRSRDDARDGQLKSISSESLRELDLHRMQPETQIVRAHRAVAKTDDPYRGNLTRASRGVGECDVGIDPQRVLATIHRRAPAQRAAARRLESR